MSSNRRPLRAAAAGAIAAALCAAPALAEPAPPYAELLKRAESAAPRLAEGRADVDQADGLARQAALRPNPSVALQVENFAGSGPLKGLGAAETTLSFTQPVETGGKRQARVAAGRAELDAARSRAAQARADFAFDLADAYARAEAAERRLKLATENLGLAQDDLRIARALVAAGKEAELRGLQAETAGAAARAARDQAQAERTTAFARLTALSGSAAPITAIAHGLLDHADRVEGPPAIDPLAAPAYRAAEAAREAAARRVNVERTRAAPDVALSVGVRRVEGDGAAALVAGVSAPLPIFDRNQGAVSAARAALRAADARLDAARLDAQADAASALARADTAQARMTAGRQAERTAEEAYRLTRLGYEAGKTALVEVIAARRALTDARTELLAAQQERLAAEAALARLQGLVPFGDQP
ncbi:transporter [Caulobacter sp. CCUG 60055]|uniref:TolC family protein n=1 Tax=Caulobacter sp. CCUG 60055 TaxID=2100090 RepID=UPI001FA77D22|nr:TolC family protein [Caulobacter sp. CCUG 60055]MBQ1542522.1 TolC family protein [Caulobacteraceae bacterium]MCI3180408.1 transporter [Caulobacter sp. CCUG 60055]